MGKYRVYVEENSAYMDESERRVLAEFDDCEAAQAACGRVVDDFLAHCDASKSAEEIYSQYALFGEDAWIASDDPDCAFSSHDYARERARQLAKPPGSDSDSGQGEREL